MTIKSSLKDLIKKRREADLYLLKLILLHSVVLFCSWLHLSSLLVNPSTAGKLITSSDHWSDLNLITSDRKWARLHVTWWEDTRWCARGGRTSQTDAQELRRRRTTNCAHTRPQHFQCWPQKLTANNLDEGFFLEFMECLE